MTYPSDNIPPYQTQVQPLATSGWAIASIIAAILGWLGVFGLGGIIAVVCGHVAKSEIRNSAGRIGGDGIATVGLVLGYLNIALTLITACLGILIFAGVISGAAICPFLFDGTSF